MMAKWFELESDSSDILVTPNHRMLIRWSNLAGWKVKEAHDLLKHRAWTMKVSATWKGNNVEPMLTIPFLRNKYKQTVTKEVSLFSLMQFLGYYLSEGSAHTYQIRIFQAENSEHLNEIRLLLKKPSI